MYRTLGGHQCRSGRVRKISLPTGFDPRTVDSVTSHLTVVLLKIPVLLGRDTVLLSNNFLTFRNIVLISFSEGTLDHDDMRENSGSVRPITKCLLIKDSNFQIYIYWNRMIPTSLIVSSISSKIGNSLHYVITSCRVAQTASYPIREF
jgi:hypothetical protein